MGPGVALGDDHRRFRHADSVDGLVAGHRLLQRHRIRQAHVFRSEADEPPGDVAWLLARRKHARGIVERSIRTAPPQAFVQRADQVVVEVAVAVLRGAVGKQKESQPQGKKPLLPSSDIGESMSLPLVAMALNRLNQQAFPPHRSH